HGEHFASPHGVGGNSAEGHQLPVELSPRRLAVGNAVVACPARGIPGAISAIVLAAPVLGAEGIGTGASNELGTVDGAPVEARAGLLGKTRHLRGREVGIAATDLKEEPYCPHFSLIDSTAQAASAKKRTCVARLPVKRP